MPKQVIFSSTDIDSVLHVMPDPTRTVIHKGWFPDTFSDVTDETFCFVSLDADLYAPTAAALPLFYERLATGGVLLIHDVYSTQFSGCRKAVGEFCLKKPSVCRSCMRSAWKRNDPKIIKETPEPVFTGTSVSFSFIYCIALFHVHA
ncbi:TylF/MycF family methyltransferase [Blautia wexlerae]|nr:TylF/MycF family methyltransferase [Blautia wexlerae]